MKQRLLAIVCGFAVQLAGLLLIHSVWLKADYLATAGIWRPMAEQTARAWAMLLSILVYAIAAVLLYKPGPKSEPVWKRGLSFGVLLAMAVVAYGSLSGWVILPLPAFASGEVDCGRGAAELHFRGGCGGNRALRGSGVALAPLADEVGGGFGPFGEFKLESGIEGGGRGRRGGS